jgi:hypothetical protein
MPTTSTGRGTAAALLDVYEDLLSDVQKSALWTAKRFRLNFDDALADANLIFVEAYLGFDPGRSDIGQRVSYLVRRRIIDDARIAERVRTFGEGAVPLDLLPCATQETPHFALGAFTAGLSPDAQRLVCLALEPPHELKFAIADDPAPEPDCTRNQMGFYAADVWGWGAERFRAAFEEVSESL